MELIEINYASSNSFNFILCSLLIIFSILLGGLFLIMLYFIQVFDTVLGVTCNTEY